MKIPTTADRHPLDCGASGCVWSDGSGQRTQSGCRCLMPTGNVVLDRQSARAARLHVQALYLRVLNAEQAIAKAVRGE